MENSNPCLLMIAYQRFSSNNLPLVLFVSIYVHNTQDQMFMKHNSILSLIPP